MTCKLSDIVSPAFSEPHRALKSEECNQLVLKGGRGSAKSSYASVEGALSLLKNPDIHGVVMRKVSNTLRTSVYAQYMWAITALGLYDKFKFTTGPMEITYRKTGQKILFFGADDPGKLKSIKVPFGYIGFLHLEELDQFAGEEEVRNIEQSILRGGPLAYEIKTFNPPRTVDNWANKYCLSDKPGQLIHHSTYETTPPDWLGQRFLDDAEYLKQVDFPSYEHEYLGQANGTGGMVFDNLEIRTITDVEISTFDGILNGVDFGWYPDPWVFVRVYFDAARRVLYILDEKVANKTSNQVAADIIKSRIDQRDMVICDSAEPKSIDDYVSCGLRARGAEKGPGSLDYSFKWLQSLRSIVIDRARCPVAFDEFTQYEYDRDKNGSIISGYPDRNNHTIDAVRYATNRIWRRRGK